MLELCKVELVAVSGREVGDEELEGEQIRDDVVVGSPCRSAGGCGVVV